MMKPKNAPRQVYTRNKVTHICFSGKFFAPAKTTQIKKGALVKVEAKDKNHAMVVLRKPKQKAITEIWNYRKAI